MSSQKPRIARCFSLVFAIVLLLGVQGAAMSRADILYVANSGNNTIVKVTSSGVASTFATSGLYGPEGVAFDGAGNLYAANFFDNTIEKFTPSALSE